MILARQNGKNVVFEARELGGLFLLGEQLILHTAHQYKTAIEAFRRVDEIATNYDWFRRKVKRVTRTNGEEGIELNSGARLRFIARSKASAAGVSPVTASSWMRRTSWATMRCRRCCRRSRRGRTLSCGTGRQRWHGYVRAACAGVAADPEGSCGWGSGSVAGGVRVGG